MMTLDWLHWVLGYLLIGALILIQALRQYDVTVYWREIGIFLLLWPVLLLIYGAIRSWKAVWRE